MRSYDFDGKLLEDDVCHGLRAGGPFELLQLNRLAGDDVGLATPALVGGQLLIRTAGTTRPSQASSPAGFWRSFGF